jgi:hypothetical protein
VGREPFLIRESRGSCLAVAPFPAFGDAYHPFHNH